MPVRRFRERWGVDIRVGKRRLRLRSPENSRAGAAAYEAHLRTEMRARGADALFQRRRAFEDAVEEWFQTDVQGNRTPATQRHYRSILRHWLLPRFGDYFITDISTLEVERYKADLVNRGCSPALINNVLIVLSRFYTCALEWGWVSRRPTVRWKPTPPTRFDFLSHTECHALLATARGTPWHDMILCAIRTGMRRSELQALAWEDLDLARGLVTVRRSLSDGVLSTPKNKRDRIIRMLPDLVEALANRPRIGPYVFAGKEEPRRLRRPMERALERLVAETGLRRITWHTLRHTFASQLVSAGVPLLAVMKLMGHRSLQMTMVYAHLAPAALDDAIGLLGRAAEAELRDGHKMGTSVASTTPSQRTNSETMANASVRPSRFGFADGQ